MSRHEPTDNPEALGLEQFCVEPGLWRIEGYTVIRNGDYWQIWQFGKHLKNRRTLAAVREWIWENK